MLSSYVHSTCFRYEGIQPKVGMAGVAFNYNFYSQIIWWGAGDRLGSVILTVTCLTTRDYGDRGLVKFKRASRIELVI